jgi:hypothetical protein
MDYVEKQLLKLQTRVADLELRKLQKEFDAPKAAAASKWSSPLLLSILAGIGTAGLAIFNNWWQFQSTIAVERTKLESSLILKAIDSPDAAERKTALLFLVNAGLIDDPANKIKTMEVEAIPQIVPTASAVSGASRWSIILGGRSTLEAAQTDVAMARKANLGEVEIYFRRNSYRTVVTFDNRTDADEKLSSAKSTKTDAYLVKMASWCPETRDKGSYKECVGT